MRFKRCSSLLAAALAVCLLAELVVVAATERDVKRRYRQRRLRLRTSRVSSEEDDDASPGGIRGPQQRSRRGRFLSRPFEMLSDSLTSSLMFKLIDESENGEKMGDVGEIISEADTVPELETNSLKEAVVAEVPADEEDILPTIEAEQEPKRVSSRARGRQRMRQGSPTATTSEMEEEAATEASEFEVDFPETMRSSTTTDRNREDASAEKLVGVHETSIKKVANAFQRLRSKPDDEGSIDIAEPSKEAHEVLRAYKWRPGKRPMRLHRLKGSDEPAQPIHYPHEEGPVVICKDPNRCPRPVPGIDVYPPPPLVPYVPYVARPRPPFTPKPATEDGQSKKRKKFRPYIRKYGFRSRNNNTGNAAVEVTTPATEVIPQQFPTDFAKEAEATTNAGSLSTLYRKEAVRKHKGKAVLRRRKPGFRGRLTHSPIAKEVEEAPTDPSVFAETEDDQNDFVEVTTPSTTTTTTTEATTPTTSTTTTEEPQVPFEPAQVTNVRPAAPSMPVFSAFEPRPEMGPPKFERPTHPTRPPRLRARPRPPVQEEEEEEEELIPFTFTRANFLRTTTPTTTTYSTRPTTTTTQTIRFNEFIQTSFPAVPPELLEDMMTSPRPDQPVVEHIMEEMLQRLPKQGPIDMDDIEKVMKQAIMMEKLRALAETPTTTASTTTATPRTTARPTTTPSTLYFDRVSTNTPKLKKFHYKQRRPRPTSFYKPRPSVITPGVVETVAPTRKTYSFRVMSPKDAAMDHLNEIVKEEEEESSTGEKVTFRPPKPETLQTAAPYSKPRSNFAMLTQALGIPHFTDDATLAEMLQMSDFGMKEGVDLPMPSPSSGSASVYDLSFEDELDDLENNSPILDNVDPPSEANDSKFPHFSRKPYYGPYNSPRSTTPSPPTYKKYSFKTLKNAEKLNNIANIKTVPLPAHVRDDEQNREVIPTQETNPTSLSTDSSQESFEPLPPTESYAEFDAQQSPFTQETRPTSYAAEEQSSNTPVAAFSPSSPVSTDVLPTQAQEEPEIRTLSNEEQTPDLGASYSMADEDGNYMSFSIGQHGGAEGNNNNDVQSFSTHRESGHVNVGIKRFQGAESAQPKPQLKDSEFDLHQQLMAMMDDLRKEKQSKGSKPEVDISTDTHNFFLDMNPQEKKPQSFSFSGLEMGFKPEDVPKEKPAPQADGESTPSASPVDEDPIFDDQSLDNEEQERPARRPSYDNPYLNYFHSGEHPEPTVGTPFTARPTDYAKPFTVRIKSKLVTTPRPRLKPTLPTVTLGANTNYETRPPYPARNRFRPYQSGGGRNPFIAPSKAVKRTPGPLFVQEAASLTTPKPLGQSTPFTVRPTSTPFTRRPTKSLIPRLNYMSESKPKRKTPGIFDPNIFKQHDVELKSGFERSPIWYQKPSGAVPPKPNLQNHRLPPPPTTKAPVKEESTPESFNYDYLAALYDEYPDLYSDGLGSTKLASSGVPKSPSEPVFIEEGGIDFPDLDAIIDDPKEGTSFVGFGDAQFGLPAGGKLPDRPVKKSTPRPDIDGDEQPMYLKNPFGSDFIRLEVDVDRYQHNKTSSVGIHHIPLMINGAPQMSLSPGHVKKPHIEHLSKKKKKPLLHRRPALAPLNAGVKLKKLRPRKKLRKPSFIPPVRIPVHASVKPPVVKKAPKKQKVVVKKEVGKHAHLMHQVQSPHEEDKFMGLRTLGLVKEAMDTLPGLMNKLMSSFDDAMPFTGRELPDQAGIVASRK